MLPTINYCTNNKISMCNGYGRVSSILIYVIGGVCFLKSFRISALSFRKVGTEREKFFDGNVAATFTSEPIISNRLSFLPPKGPAMTEPK